MTQKGRTSWTTFIGMADLVAAHARLRFSVQQEPLGKLAPPVPREPQDRLDLRENPAFLVQPALKGSRARQVPRAQRGPQDQLDHRESLAFPELLAPKVNRVRQVPRGQRGPQDQLDHGESLVFLELLAPKENKV